MNKAEQITQGKTMTDYSKMTQVEFDRILTDLVKHTTAEELLFVPGLYEVLSEHFNNEVLDVWAEAQPLAEEIRRDLEESFQ